MEQFYSSLPTGYLFDPTDEELVGDFLFKKTNNIELDFVEKLIVRESDLYGQKEPWQLWEDFSQNLVFTDATEPYFFAPLKKRPKSSRYLRSVGKGTWHGENEGEVVDAEAMVNDGEAARKVLVQAMRKRYNNRNKDSAHHGCWILHEFSMLNSTSNWVLCRLRRNNSASDDDNASDVNGVLIYKSKMMDSDAKQDPNKRLKVTHDSESIDPQNHVSKTDGSTSGTCIVVAEQNNDFLACNDLATCGLITNQQPMLMPDRFTSQPIQTYSADNDFGYFSAAHADADSDLLMICYSSEDPPASINELFGNGQSFMQSGSSPD